MATMSKKVSLSFTSKSKKVSSALNLRQQSIKTHRDEEYTNAQSVTNNVDDLFTKKEKEAIIPLIKNNKWRQPSTKPPPLEYDEYDENEDNDEDMLEKQQQEALDIILKQNDSSDMAPIIRLAPKETNKGAFNQMAMNKVPGVEDIMNAKKKLEIDCAQRPKAPDEEEYSDMPISSFGAALLKGMGWNKSMPIGNQYGKNTLKLPETASVKPRPKNLGLGATLTKKEADMMVKRKYNPNKQRTDTERKRIAEIHSWTKTNREPPKKKRKVLHESRDERAKTMKKQKIKWIKTGLRVRCVKHDEYFRQKGTVIDVIDEYRVSLKMDKDSKLVTLFEDEVNTVIPNKGKFVLILRGINQNERGSILDKNKHKQHATVQLEHNLSIVECDYEDICAI